ncbi:helix-turn-helix domain-containing protein [Mycobacterium sp. IS-836]|uniref:helix-turn-helix domain-containing protein n=1 Tax=Mycobacterium sp. IS-836 TaxID=1834160 RepID=UPI00114DF919|nr:helix-turn-helix domain-containing protein [Mycobacterium sp. IS-836]
MSGRVASGKCAGATGGSFHDDGRGVIQGAFELLGYLGALEPVRLRDLANVSGIPRETVRRMLQQLIAVGAVSREGTRYRLGPSLLELGAQVGSERRLRTAARRPIAELATATGAAVHLSTMIGGELVYLDAVDARVPVRFTAEPGARVPPRTAAARAQIEMGSTAPIVDPGGVIADLSCVAVAIPLGNGAAAVVSALVPGPRPPLGVLAATRATGTRIVSLLHPPRDPDETGPDEVAGFLLTHRAG